MKMRKLRGWVLRLFGLFSRKRREREFAEELASHLALHMDDNLRAGLSPAEARRAASAQRFWRRRKWSRRASIWPQAMSPPPHAGRRLSTLVRSSLCSRGVKRSI